MPKIRRKKYHNKVAIKPDIPRESEIYAAPRKPKLKELLSSYERFREKGDRKICALALHNSTDNLSDTALSLDWLGNSSGFKLLNKKRGKIFFDDCNILSNKDLAYCKNRLLADRGRELVIFLVAHGNTGVTFCNEKAGFSDPRAWAVGELKGARLFAETVKKIESFFDVRIKGVVLNSCFSGAEIEYNHKFVPSSTRLLSILLTEIPVVGFVGVCADSKITRLHLDDSGVHKSLSRHEASILCQDGVVVDDCSHEVRIDHSLTLLSILRACEIYETHKFYNPCDHIDFVENSLNSFRMIRKRDCYGAQLLRRALTCAAEIEKRVLELERGEEAFPKLEEISLKVRAVSEEQVARESGLTITQCIEGALTAKDLALEQVAPKRLEADIPRAMKLRY